MKTKIVITDNFEKEAKKLLKKYKSLKNELSALESRLLETPQIGTPLGNSVFKIRLAVKSKGKGKRGGLRIITNLEVSIVKDEKSNKLFLLSIYDKSKTDNISVKEINRLISRIN